MTFIDVKIPEYPLRYFIKSIIYYEGYSAISNFEMLLPDGNSQLIITLDDNERVLENTDVLSNRSQSFKSFWIAGIQTKPIVYKAEKNATTLCIQFNHGGLNALFGIPAHEFQDKMLDASLIINNELCILREKLLACNNHTQIIRTITLFLENKLSENVENLRFLSFVIKKMCDENQSLFQVSQHSGYSQKHIIHKFKEVAGVTPKKFQKIYRFNVALLFMHQSKNVDYSDIVFNCNYFDQAHFINDFRSMTTMSPSHYLQTKKDYQHVIPLDVLR